MSSLSFPTGSRTPVRALTLHVSILGIFDLIHIITTEGEELLLRVVGHKEDDPIVSVIGEYLSEKRKAELHRQGNVPASLLAQSYVLWATLQRRENCGMQSRCPSRPCRCSKIVRPGDQLWLASPDGDDQQVFRHITMIDVLHTDYKAADQLEKVCAAP